MKELNLHNTGIVRHGGENTMRVMRLCFNIMQAIMLHYSEDKMGFEMDIAAKLGPKGCSQSYDRLVLHYKHLIINPSLGTMHLTDACIQTLLIIIMELSSLT